MNTICTTCLKAYPLRYSIPKNCKSCKSKLLWKCTGCGKSDLASRSARHHIKNCPRKEFSKTKATKEQNLRVALCREKKKTQYYENSDIVKKLAKVINEELIPKDHFVLEFIEMQLELLGGFQFPRGFQWPERQLRFWKTVRYLGGSKTHNFIRGYGKKEKEGISIEQNDSEKFNLVTPSLSTLRYWSPENLDPGGGINTNLVNFFCH
eukprot:gb/GECH01006906.1/.p1 GENE.gb/GECH01006906.1/~~gb/GECH01006906.1/.p1  ORF type:complete len:208 (+),score=4.20 gb/GECH01006906.1/:1-624(+)